MNNLMYAVCFLLVWSLGCLAEGFQGNRDALTPLQRDLLKAFPKVRSLDELNQLIEGIEYNLAESASQPEAPSAFVPRDVLAACPQLTTPPLANDVYSLHPGNIKIVMAMGDSITAGMSAKDTSIFSLKEYRGLSYCQGADAGLTTFPNLLSNYSVVVGGSTGIGDRDSNAAGIHLNGAVSGAKIADMAGQASWLADALTKQTGINPTTDWKVLNMWIGSNNLCDVCDDDDKVNGENSAVKFEIGLRAALQTLFTIPRLVVNLLPGLDVTNLRKFTNTGVGCAIVHPIACSCATSSSASTRGFVQAVLANFTRSIYRVASEFNTPRYADRTVVVQPVLIQTQIPERSWLSAADCFHPAPIAHQNLAVALWNSVWTPVSSKPLSWTIGGSPVCPTDSTILATCPVGNPSCCNAAAEAAGYCSL